MKLFKIALLVLTTMSMLAATEASAARKGSHRYGGYNSHGKGSHYH